MPDAPLVEAIRAVLAASPFHGEGYRKVGARLRLRSVRTSKERVRRRSRPAAGFRRRGLASRGKTGRASGTNILLMGT